MQIYLLKDDERLGPFSVFEVAEKVRAGEADGDTQGWYQGSDGWDRLEDLPATSTIFIKPERRVTEEEEMAERRTRLAPERLRSSVRLWARLIDLFLFVWLIAIVSITSGMMTVEEVFLKPRVEVALLPAAVQMLVEGFLLHAFGTTPGKWLLRVQVVPDGGGRIPLGVSFRRSFTVWWRGIGFWLFPLNVFMMAISQATLLNTGKTPWDESCGLGVEFGKVDGNRILLIVGIFIGLLLVMNQLLGEELAAALEAAGKK